MDDDSGRDIGPDETGIHNNDLQMDISVEPDDEPSGSHFFSMYNSSQENNVSSMPPGYTPHQVYGTNRTVWTRFVDEPLDMTPPSMNPLTRHDASQDPVNIMEENLLYNEIARLNTFDSRWPQNAPVTPQDLAQNGFYYTGPGDRVQCVYCKGVLKKWAKGDTVKQEHRTHFPFCPVHRNQPADLVGKGGESHHTRTDVSLAHSDSMGVITKLNDETGYEVTPRENLGIVKNKPKHPQYAIESDRLATFNSWPSQMKQKPEDLAKAGLFYLGTGDKVKCFSCDGMLHSWEADDDPMSEHARWFPECSFVKLIQGDSSSLKGGKTVADAECVETSAAVQALVDNGYSLKSISKAIEQLHIDGVNENTIPPAVEILKTILETDSALEKCDTHSPDTSLQNGHSKEDDPEVKALMDENQELKEQRLCKICLENEISLIFLPCGHLACCSQCGTSLTECPICRTIIKGTAKAFWA